MIDKLKILGHEYSVIQDPNLYFDETNCAIIHLGKCEIRISTQHPTSRQEEGLIHEIVEALNYHFQLKLEHDKLSQIGEGLYQVLKDNGLLKIP